MIKNTVCCSRVPITVQASRRVCKILECAVRTAIHQFAGLLWCARRTLRAGETCRVRPAPALVILAGNAG